MFEQGKFDIPLNVSATDIQKQRVEWRRKGWSIPDVRGGKQTWYSLISELIELIAKGQESDLDTIPIVNGIENLQSWRSYAPFLKSIGLVSNQAGSLCLTDYGVKFHSEPQKRLLADFIQDKIRLFGEILEILSAEPATIEEVDEQLCRMYGLNWANLSNTRRRMDWLEVLDLIHAIGNRKWEITSSGIDAMKNWCLVTPLVLESNDSDSSDIEITDPPAEIALLLQNLADEPKNHSKRSTYNIWVPSPNRIDNLRIIVQAASERIAKVDLFHFIEDEFNLKISSIESMLPFLKVSGLLKEVGRGVYLATSAASAWLETGNDLDFIRILHSNMRFVGEMIKAAEKDIVRNDIYEKAKPYGLNVDKVRWIAGFLLEAGLLEEPQYLHLKATPTGMRFAISLPLEETPIKVPEEKSAVDKQKETIPTYKRELDYIIERLNKASRDPSAEDKASGVAFEEAIAEIFRFMGFQAERIGGSGDTDVLVRWQEDESKTVIAIVDGKSKSSGQVSHGDISDVAIDTHKEKNKADFVGIIGFGFSGDTIKNHARKKAFSLISTTQLSEVALASEALGLSPKEIGLIFQVPNGLSQLDELISAKQRELEIISVVISRFNEEQEILGCLSPRDLFLLLRDTIASPSLKELLSVFETLSMPEIGVLRASDKTNNPENTMYMLVDAKKAANRLCALASTIEKAL